MNEIRRLSPQESWSALQADERAVLLDVRATLEYGFVGHPIGAVHVPWKEWPLWQVSPAFVETVRRLVPDTDTAIFVLCRSGQRSLDAAKALQEAGYSNLSNIEEGFEGSLDADKHRGTLGGWRFHGLPWEQG
ncbi:MAG TPA: rhodanese-like domain-containing protein [Methylococcaceae bacterium]|nr:rhodanese-like domain-containing protein [Methylococcaceae bacterium]